MTRLIFHIGFPKCGSTTIFRSIAPNLKALRQQRFFVFNDKFELARRRGEVRTPLWQLQQARASAAAQDAMREKLRTQIEQAPKNSTLILSSEVLGSLAYKRMFTGFDDIADVEVIGYFRPQVDWIPSGWKQWDSREGVPLQDATEKYIAEGRPAYLDMMNTWQDDLPKARTTFRLFARDALVAQNPLHDFMTQIGVEFDTLKTLSETMNPSIDYALLHLMMRHHDLFFKTRHDSNLMKVFVSRLPAEYLKTNVAMLNTQMLSAITDAFRDDNMTMLSRSMSPDEAQKAFETYFVRPAVPEGTAYPDIPEEDILSRAADILERALGLSVADTSNSRRALAVALHQALTTT